MKLAFIGYGDVLIKQIEKAFELGYELSFWVVPKKNYSNTLSQQYNIHVITYKDFKENKFPVTDLIIINECSWFIPTKNFNGIPAINYHAGILPTWRGFSANLWALMNNELELGYSVNIATDLLDGGDIVYQYKIKNDHKSFYYDLRHEIVKDMIDKIGEVVECFFNTERLVNFSSDIRYCSRMNPDLGVINHWDLTALQIFNLYRIFGHATSSGFFLSKEKINFKVLSMEIAEINGFGISGCVIYNEEKYMFINTLEGVLKVELTEKFSNGTLFDGWKIAL